MVTPSEPNKSKIQNPKLIYGRQKERFFHYFSQLLFSTIIWGIFSIYINHDQLASTPEHLLRDFGGFILSWITNATTNSAQPPTVASSDGVDTGLKYWLFFMLGFVSLGYPAPMSIFLGGIAALGGGWITAWWGSKEEAKTQLQVEESEEGETEQSTERINKRQRRRPTRRSRRNTGSVNFKFWER